MSTVPEITESAVTNKNSPAVDSLNKTTTSRNGQTSDQQNMTKTLSFTPVQDSTNAHRQNDPPKQDSATGNPQNGIHEQNTPVRDPNKRDSTCLPLPGLLAPKGVKSQFKNPPAVPETAYSKDELAKSIDAEIKYIKDEAQKLSSYTTQIDSEINEAFDRLELLRKDEEPDFRSLRDLQKAVTKLKLQIPKQKADIGDKDSHRDHGAGTLKLKRGNMPEKVMKQAPRLYNDDLFVNSPEFRNLEALFSQLPVELKLCLLCFSIFPGNEDIKKRLMVYWWMTEGFVPPIPRDEETRAQIKDGKKTAEEFTDEYFEKLTKMGFIEPVNDGKRSLSVASYRLHPFISTALMMLGKKANFFDFDNGKPTQKFSETFQACLVGKGLIDYQDLREGKLKVQDLEKLHTVINVNEHILEFKKEWLLKMKNVNILYLGRWRASATHHIEVEDEEEEEKDFLDGLQNMNHLKFFSLQGVSRIMELPESISKLSNLRILDLRACHNLESIPEKIGLLKKLTHLDISECYLLEHMPKGIASLLELRVLKGFVVGEKNKNSCNLKDLAKLTKLIKLSIYTGLLEFPEQNDIEALQEFKVLRKLTIAWGGDALKVPSTKNASRVTNQPEDGKMSKEITREELGESTSQAMTSKIPEPTKPDEVERKENSKEIQEGDALEPQSSKIAKTPKPGEGERGKEMMREEQGENASPAQSSRNCEIHDGEEKQKMSTSEVHEENAVQTQSNKGIPEGDCKTGEKTQTATREISGRGTPSSKGIAEADRARKMDKESTPEKAAGFGTQRTIAKSLTFNNRSRQPPAPAQKQLEQLEKLDLKSFPKATTPEWLMPSILKSLKKLYIRGGKFSDLGQYQYLDCESGEQNKETWKVQVLRLKYLSELELDWRELQELFPDLVYLEKVSCPKLSFFPCDGYGVWINKVKLKQMVH